METRAAELTAGFLSTRACFKYRSIAVNIVKSVILQRDRIAVARYPSSLPVMSFVKLGLKRCVFGGFIRILVAIRGEG